MLLLEIKENKKEATIRVVRQDVFGTDFYDDHYYFQASTGFTLLSIGVMQANPRLGKLQLCKELDTKTVLTIQLNCGLNRTYIKDVKQAVFEYNAMQEETAIQKEEKRIAGIKCDFLDWEFLPDNPFCWKAESKIDTKGCPCRFHKYTGIND